jgi:hypothetical protein
LAGCSEEGDVDVGMDGIDIRKGPITCNAIVLTPMMQKTLKYTSLISKAYIYVVFGENEDS